jgi:hypothetical protein
MFSEVWIKQALTEVIVIKNDDLREIVIIPK